MDQGLIPSRYAKALYKVGAGRKVNPELYKVMQALSCAFDTEPGLVSSVANPFVTDKDKAALLRTAVQGATTDVTSLQTYTDFITLLIKNRRIDMVRETARAFTDYYRKENRIARVEVVSAVSLSPAVEARLKSIIEAHLDGGSMEYSSRVDPGLIGGFIINLNSERLDASVRNELKQLRLSLIS